MPKLIHELEELQAKGVITVEVAEKIRKYYERPTSGSNRMVIAFGIIGALLIGMGIVLIIAHNWDNLSTPAKLSVGLAPLLAAQAVAGFLVVKQNTNKIWAESVSVILVFAIATSISIVSQVYNIPGSMEGFLLTWMVLSLPVIYIVKSWMASLLFWTGITWYAVQAGNGIFHSAQVPLYYWPLAIAALPFYIFQIKKQPNANNISFHNWIIGVSLTIVLGLGSYGTGDDLIVPAYVTLFSVFILVGQLPYFASRKLISNAWLIGGSAGTIILLLGLTFEWPDLSKKPLGWWISAPLFIWMSLFLVASVLLYRLGRSEGFRNVLSKSYTFIVFLALFLVGLIEPVMARLLCNVLILALGIYTIREGALDGKLRKMNYGLLILSGLIICRFFDTDLSFVVRGLLFVGIGAGFFGMNYYMMRKRKTAL